MKGGCVMDDTVRRVNVEAEGGCEAVVYSEDFLKLNQAKVAFCDMWMKN